MSGKVTHGADVERLDDIAVGLRRQGTRVADVGGRGAAQLETLRALWHGPDFEKFANQWRTAHRCIDEAEAAMRTFSRKLVAEADQQRQSSHPTSGPDLAGGGATRPVGESAPRGGGAAPTGPGGLVRGGEVGASHGRPQVEPLREGLTALTVDGPDGQLHLISPHGMLVTDGLLVTLPTLPGAEPADAGQAPAFERMDHGRGDVGGGATPPSSSVPVQVPTGEGTHVTTGSEAAGQRSVAFDPRAVGWAEPVPVGHWLRLDPEPAPEG